MKTVFGYFLSLAFLIPSIICADQISKHLTPTPVEYQVYDALLAEVLGVEEKSNKSQDDEKNSLIVISEVTREGNGNFQELIDRIDNKDLQTETKNDFISQNYNQSYLEDRFKFSKKHLILSEKKHDQLFKRTKGKTLSDSWKEFYKNFPNSHGFLTFSRVGFNKKMNQTLVYFAINCGGLCGEGSYYVLEKYGDQWKLAKEMRAWIS